MDTDELKNMWKKESALPDNDKPLTMKAMEVIISKRSKSANLKIKFDVYFSLLLYSVTFCLCIYNFTRYLQAPNLVWILPLMGVVLILLAFQSIKLIPGINKMKMHQTSLRESITETIFYFKKRYSLWQIIFPVGVIILTYNINLIADYEPAGYKIYQPDVFIIVTAAMYLFIYILFRFTRRIYLADLENCLKNLDSIDYTAIEKNVRRSKLVIIAVVAGLLVLFLGGLFMFLRSAGKI